MMIPALLGLPSGGQSPGETGHRLPAADREMTMNAQSAPAAHRPHFTQSARARAAASKRPLPSSARATGFARFGRESARLGSQMLHVVRLRDRFLHARDCLRRPARPIPRRQPASRRKSRSVAPPAAGFDPFPQDAQARKRALFAPRQSLAESRARTRRPRPPAPPSPPVLTPCQPEICPFAHPIATACRRRDLFRQNAGAPRTRPPLPPFTTHCDRGRPGRMPVGRLRLRRPAGHGRAHPHRSSSQPGPVEFSGRRRRRSAVPRKRPDTPLRKSQHDICTGLHSD